MSASDRVAMADRLFDAGYRAVLGDTAGHPRRRLVAAVGEMREASLRVHVPRLAPTRVRLGAMYDRALAAALARVDAVECFHEADDMEAVELLLAAGDAWERVVLGPLGEMLCAEGLR